MSFGSKEEIRGRRYPLIEALATVVAAGINTLDVVAAADIPAGAILEVVTKTDEFDGHIVQVSSKGAAGVPTVSRSVVGRTTSIVYQPARGGDVNIYAWNLAAVDRTINRTVTAIVGIPLDELVAASLDGIRPTESAVLAGNTTTSTLFLDNVRCRRAEGWVTANQTYTVVLRRYYATTTGMTMTYWDEQLVADAAAGSITKIDVPYLASGHLELRITNTGADTATIIRTINGLP